MSCYEWENGSIKIPSKVWASFKKTVRDEYNRLQDQTHANAKIVFNELKKAGKGKRKFDYSRTLSDWWSGVGNNAPMGVKHLSDNDFYAIRSTIFVDGKLRSPLKKSFPHATNTTNLFDYDWGSFTFDNTDRTVNWDVAENNHAVDYAHGQPIAKYLFARISTIPWIKNSGGTFWGNDEYNQESRGSGGGNYITRDFGPIGRKEREYSHRY
ncbi:MAG: hypothetical protein DRH08_05855 [Deltaproteobacteria bacterium]|nr:MAG: hypothetical protein DRH08_05855 [Deltaproteobacteria bacterium]